MNFSGWHESTFPAKLFYVEIFNPEYLKNAVNVNKIIVLGLLGKTKRDFLLLLLFYYQHSISVYDIDRLITLCDIYIIFF